MKQLRTGGEGNLKTKTKDQPVGRTIIIGIIYEIVLMIFTWMQKHANMY